MIDTIERQFDFKFHWLSEQGHQTTMFSKKGSFDGEMLVLEETEIPASIIVESIVRENRMVLSVFTGEEENPVAHLLIQPSSKKVTEQLKERLDIARSSVWAKNHKEDLEKKGLGHTYRDEICDACGATLILSEMEKSPQLYCHFCDSLTTIDPNEEPLKNEQAFKICEECGLFSKPQKFTIFYFYFLVFFYGWWSKPTWRCPACMRGEAWKMFFGNFIFLLGVPVAVVQLFRSYSSDAIGGSFKGLDTGNIRARNGNVSGALEQYRAILERVPYSAGVKYNLGLALLLNGDDERAAQTFELALEDCSNYAPAAQQLRALYPRLGETEKLKELERVWSGEDENSDQNNSEKLDDAEFVDQP